MWCRIKENGMEWKDDVHGLGVTVRRNLFEEEIVLIQITNKLKSTKSLSSRERCDCQVVYSDC